MTAMRITTIVAGIMMGAGLIAKVAAGDVVIEVGEAISLKAEEVTLREVLLKIKETVPLTLKEQGEALDEPVSLTLEAETWQALFLQLLGKESFLLTIDGETETPTRLVVRWNAVREIRATAGGDGSARVVDDVESRIRALASDALAPADIAGEAVATMEEARDDFEVARGGPNEGMAKEAYLESIRGLEAYDELRTVESLLPAFDLDDRDARLATLETMRWLSETERDPKAVDAAIGSFETADDPEVERAALEVLVRYADQREVMRLLEPLALTEGPNQDMAAREWIRIRDEQMAEGTTDQQLRNLRQRPFARPPRGGRGRSPLAPRAVAPP